jgi:hypothetical protein
MLYALRQFLILPAAVLDRDVADGWREIRWP